MLLRISTYVTPYILKKKEIKEDDELYEKLKSICQILNFPFNKFYISSTTTTKLKSMKSSRNIICRFLYKLKGVLCFNCRCNDCINHYGNLITKKKNIIISKSFVNELNNLNEIDGLFVHEYYHYFYNSNIVLFFIYTMCDYVFMYLLYTFMTNYSIFRSFGYTDTPSAIGYAIFITCLTNSILLIINVIKHSIIYTYEYSADKYAISMSYGNELHKALKHSFNQYEDEFNPDILFSLCYYKHPPVVNRLKKIEEYLSNSTVVYENYV